MGGGGRKQPRFHRNKQGGMVTLGVSGLLLTVDPGSSNRAVKELQILLEPYREKLEVIELGEGGSDTDNSESGSEDEGGEERPSATPQAVAPTSSLAAELAAELDGFRNSHAAADKAGARRVQLYDEDGNFVAPADDDDQKNGKGNHANNNKGGNNNGTQGPRKPKRDWRSEWFSSLETNCKGHIFINIPRKRTKEDIARGEAESALKQLLESVEAPPATATVAAMIGEKRPREEGEEVNPDCDGGGVLDLTALLSGGVPATAEVAQEAKETSVAAGEGNTVARGDDEAASTATAKRAPPISPPNMRVSMIVDLLMDNLAADPRPVCRFAYRMFPVWSTCYPTTASITALCKTIAETAIEIPEGQSAAKVGIHLAVKNNTTVDKDKAYLKAAIESTLVGTRKCIVMPRYSGNMTVEVDCVVTVLVMHSICCVGVQTHYHTKFGRRGYNLHAFSKGAMNFGDSTGGASSGNAVPVAPSPTAPAEE